MIIYRAYNRWILNLQLLHFDFKVVGLAFYKNFRKLLRFLI